MCLLFIIMLHIECNALLNNLRVNSSYHLTLTTLRRYDLGLKDDLRLSHRWVKLLLGFERWRITIACLHRSESSDYSDWTADSRMNLQPPKRTSQRPIKKKKISSSEEEEDSEQELHNRTRQATSKSRRGPAKKRETRRERNVGVYF